MGIASSGWKTGSVLRAAPQGQQRRGGPATEHPRRRELRSVDVVAVLGGNALLLGLMWLRHGGLSVLGGASGDLTAAGELTALLGTYGALVQLVLMSRSPWLEQLFGLDGLAAWHRRLGFSTVVLICAHVVCTTAGYALGDGRSLLGETGTLVTTYPYMLMATAATALLLLVAVSSMRFARRRLEHETWQFIHVYVYLAIALAFGHQLAVGSDLSDDPVARAYWSALYVVAGGLILLFRVGHPLQLALRHELRVASVVPEAGGVASVYIEGRRLDRLQARAGQYFLWRFLARDRWWRAHPFSLSAVPTERSLRITVKAVGNGSRDVHRLMPGTRVFVDGPFGRFTARRLQRSGILFIAGGIGVTPVRALLEELPAGKRGVILIYRVRRHEDLALIREIEELARARRAVLHVIIGDPGSRELPRDPLAPQQLQHLVPDVRHREVFVCGPAGMMAVVRGSLERLHVPNAQVHYERFALL